MLETYYPVPLPRRSHFHPQETAALTTKMGTKLDIIKSKD
jgi:hypothetical protein